MKKKLTKIISSILVLTLLVSLLTVFASADETDTGTEEEVTLILNREFDEGWNVFNGFKSAVTTNSYTIEYEETDKFDYNYFARIEYTADAGSYLQFEYGKNAPQDGGSVFELDLKTDDFCSMFNSQTGTSIIYFDAANSNRQFKLAAIDNNQLKLPAKGDLNGLNDKSEWIEIKPSVDVGSLSDEWVHFSIVFSVKQRVCPHCGEVYNMSSLDSEDTILCKCNATDEVAGVSAAGMAKRLGIRLYFGYADTFDASNAVAAGKKVDLNATNYIDYYCSNLENIESVFLGIPANPNAKLQSYMVDNVRAYNGTTTPGRAVTGYGVAVDANAAKTEEIKTGNATMTVNQYIDSGLVMKTGINTYLNQSKKQNIFETEDGVAYGAPVKINGTVYLPIQTILDYVGYPMYMHDDGISFDISTASGSTFVTVGRNTATSGGKTIELNAAPMVYTDAATGAEYVVVSKDDVKNLFPGYYVTYDDMGLIIIATSDNLVSRESDLDLMLDLMKRFIFETATGSEYVALTKENTNNFSHPYLFANQEEFDSLKAVNEATEGAENYDADLKGYISSVVAQAEEAYVTYANTDDVISETGTYLAAQLVNPYIQIDEYDKVNVNNGYHPKNGRNDEIVKYAEDLRLIAFAYQVTGEVKYARLAYEIAVSLGRWDHWAPAYFINCADATVAYATAYDWLYNIWTECGFRLEPIEDAIYQKGVYFGYMFTEGLAINDKDNRNEGVFAIYDTQENIWNAVCTSDMVIASLAIMGSDYISKSDGDLENPALKNIRTLIENNIGSLIELGLDAYAPDGSFIESPDNWSYATGKLMQMIWALGNTVGSDLGLLSTWGFENTFYFAIQTEYKVLPTGESLGGYAYWNYHESHSAVLNTDMLFFAASAMGDDVLGGIRAEQIASKGASMWDILAYDVKYLSVDTTGKLELDYVMEGCDGFISRSDFSDTAIIVGMMGNANDATSGQIDSGNFIYANQGYTWLQDIGADAPGLYRYSDNTYRYKYYRNSGEGNNVVIVNTGGGNGALIYGQTETGSGELEDFYTSEYGMYGIIDNTDVYGGNAQSAKRAVLMTNDRKTVVVQDDISFWKAQAATWIAHTSAETIVISDDGRTAYLNQYINGLPVMLRLTIVEPGSALKFEKLKTTSGFLLKNTNAGNASTAAGGEAEYDRSGLSRLVIRQSEQMTFRCAIVMEIVDKLNSTLPVEYEYNEIKNWNESMVKESYTSTVKNENVLSSPELMHIVTYTEEATGYVKNGRAYGMRLNEFFRAMVRVASAVETFEPTGQIGRIQQVYLAHKDFVEYRDQYNLFREDVNVYLEEASIIATYMGGYN